MASGETLERTIKKWGNGKGLYVPTSMANELKLKVGSEVRLSIVGNSLLISPTEAKP